MVIIKLHGGLGNQMFQYALGRKLELERGLNVKYDFSFFKNQSFRAYELHYFGLNLKKATRFDLLRVPVEKTSVPNVWKTLIRAFRPLEYIKQNSFGFDDRFLQSSADAYLEGYWQTERYFQDIRDQLIKDFTFQQTLNAENVKAKQLIEQTNSVSIHFRRGDYIGDTTKIFKTCDWQYYVNGINKIASKVKNPYFFIFSDEPEWCRQNIKFNFPVFVVDANQNSNHHLDMYLMSICKHNIIANSSFSWWGAWLNSNQEKLVVAPRDWFADKSIHTADIIPSNWISI